MSGAVRRLEGLKPVDLRPVEALSDADGIRGTRLQSLADRKLAVEDITARRLEAKAEKAERIRNRQEPCPTCISRSYQDESDDGGVSFQAPTHLPASTAGVGVLRHENEHVNRSDTGPGETEKGMAKNSTISLRHDICPECGRNYVAGGVTKTRSIPAPPQNNPDPANREGLGRNVDMKL